MWIVAVLLWGGCGHPPDPVGGDPGGGDGGGSTDAATGDPDGTSGDGAPPDARDPALCPVGVADGCCPLLVNGGHDPDCPSLACDHFTRSEPIALDDPAIFAPGETLASWQGQVALAWTGSELALVWNLLLTPDPDPSQTDLVMETRAADGSLAMSPIRTVEPDINARAMSGVTALGYEPGTRTFLYANTPFVHSYKVIALDHDGHTPWHTWMGSVCNTLDAAVRVHVGGGRFVVSHDDITCAGSTYQPGLDVFAPDGTGHVRTAAGDGGLPDEAYGSSTAYDPATDRVFAVWYREYEGGIRGRFFDLATSTLEDGADLLPDRVNGYGHTGAVFDGQSYGIVVETREPCTHCGVAHAQTFRRWQPGAGWLGTPTPMTIDFRTLLPPSVVWTGDGYLVTAMTFDTSATEVPIGEHDQLTSYVWSFAADGTLREYFQLDTDPAIYPQAVWAGGRIAISWVRVAGGTERHYLQYLSCS